MKKYILLLVAIVTFSSCNDAFLDRAPVNSQVEGTAFVTYENFQTYAWSMYKVFTNSGLGSQGMSIDYYRGRGDQWAGYLSGTGESSNNAYGFNLKTIPASDAGWKFEEIRRANIMLQNIDKGEITELEKAHWTGVARFFRAYSYVELLSRYGDVPWIERAAQNEDDDEIVYAVQTPRVIVADNIMKDLLFAIENIDNTKEGGNSINKDCAKALLSRFGLFEGTWRNYHVLDDSAAEFKKADLLKKAADVSKELITSYSTMHSHFNGKYLEQELSKAHGVILYQEFISGLQKFGHNLSRYEGSGINLHETHQAMIDMYLCSDGKTISNSPEYGGAKKSIYHEFRNRDARLLLTFIPPYHTPDAKTKKKIHFTPPPALNIDPMEYQSVIAGLTTNPLWMQIPAKNWDKNLTIYAFPNLNAITHASRTSRSGYTFSRHCSYEDNNAQNQQTSDKPIFYIEEVMLNYAELMYEMGSFTQAVADITINKLRARVGVTDMNVGQINDSFDPKRDKTVNPVLWEIRRERIVELMGEGFGFNDIRRWKTAKWFINRPFMGFYMRHSDHSKDATGTTPHPSYTKIQLTVDGNSTSTSIKEGYIYRFPDPTTQGNGWKDAYYLFPIPSVEILLNKKLKQNFGWDAI